MASLNKRGDAIVRRGNAPWSAGLRHAVCITGSERSFSEIGLNVKAGVEDLLSTPNGTSVFFGVRPVNESWTHLRRLLPLADVEPQGSWCREAPVETPKWYQCSNRGRVDCRRNFVQSLCDLMHCEHMISAHEVREGRPFDSVMRVRPDAIWESRLDFPWPLDNRSVYVPYMEARVGRPPRSGVNDHMALGGRLAMRLYLTRIRYATMNATEIQAGLPFAFAPPATSELFLRATLQRDHVVVKPLGGWAYCMLTKNSLMLQGKHSCVKRWQRSQRCGSLECPVVLNGCFCHNATCSSLAANRKLKDPAGCSDVEGRQLLPDLLNMSTRSSSPPRGNHSSPRGGHRHHQHKEPVASAGAATRAGSAAERGSPRSRPGWKPWKPG